MLANPKYRTSFVKLVFVKSNFLVHKVVLKCFENNNFCLVFQLVSFHFLSLQLQFLSLVETNIEFRAKLPQNLLLERSNGVID